MACDPATHRCAMTCKSSGECAAPTPYCSDSSHFCVQCLAQSDCARLDLDRPADELMADIRESVRQHGATGYVDPKFLELQNISAAQ